MHIISVAEVCSVKSRAIWVQLLITGSGVGTLLGVVINYYINQHMHVRAAYTVSSLVLLFGAWLVCISTEKWQPERSLVSKMYIETSTILLS